MTSTGLAALPADLFHLLSSELSARQDFSTLFNCIVSSKHFANSGAITALYRCVGFLVYEQMMQGANNW